MNVYKISKISKYHVYIIYIVILEVEGLLFACDHFVHCTLVKQIRSFILELCDMLVFCSIYNKKYLPCSQHHRISIH